MSECNSIEHAYLTYYQKNWDVILNRAEDYYENDKKRLTVQARDKYRNLSQEKKMKKENVEKIDIAICLKKKSKDQKNIKKIIVKQKKSKYNNK